MFSTGSNSEKDKHIPGLKMNIVVVTTITFTTTITITISTTIHATASATPDAAITSTSLMD